MRRHRWTQPAVPAAIWGLQPGATPHFCAPRHAASLPTISTFRYYPQEKDKALSYDGLIKVVLAETMGSRGARKAKGDAAWGGCSCGSWQVVVVQWGGSLLQRWGEGWACGAEAPLGSFSGLEVGGAGGQGRVKGWRRRVAAGGWSDEDGARCCAQQVASEQERWARQVRSQPKGAGRASCSAQVGRGWRCRAEKERILKRK